MADDPVRLLLVHGTIVLSLGVLAGLPFWLAIIRERGAEPIHGWRVAHATLIVNGLLLLMVALMGPHLDLSETLSALAAWALVASAYGFVFALGGGAWFGERGLNPLPLGVNTLFFVGHAVGATGAIVGVGAVLSGLLR
jgi:hypothetical protein